MKKALAFLLTAALLTGLCVSAFASGDMPSGDPMGGSAELETVTLTEDTALSAGEYSENVDCSGFTLTLDAGAKLSGAVNGGRLIVGPGAKWTVTGTSALSYLAIDADAVIAGTMGKAATMTVDGVIEILRTGSVYEGDIEVYFGDMTYPLYITDASGEITVDDEADVEFSGELTDNALSDFTFASKTHGLLDLTGEMDGFFTIGGETQHVDASELDLLPEVQEKLHFTGFNSTLQGWTAPAISITGGANAVIEGLYADTDYHVMEIGGAESAGDTIAVYRDTYLNRQTFDGDTIGGSSWCHTTSLFARGNVRMSMSVGNSQTYYYGTAAVVDGWSAMATDAGGRTGVDVLIYNSFARNLLGGYGTYADTGCRVFLYGTDFRSAEFGGIIANNGEIYVTDSDEASTDTNTLRAEVSAPYQSFAYDTLEPLAYAEEDDILAENTPSACLAFRNGIMMHVPDLMGAGGRISDKPGILYVKNATLGTSLECAPEDWATGGYEKSWTDMADEAIWAWIEHTLGSAILVRSDNAVIKLTNADIRSWSGVILQSILNADAHGNFIGPDETVSDYVGIWLEADGNTALVGDIRHEDYQRAMHVTLSDSASLTGDIFTGTVEDWHTVFADYADAGTEFYRDLDGYDKIWGTEVTLNAGSAWTVTNKSNITSLTVMPGATLNASVSVDGTPTEIQPGVTYTGDIRLTAAGAEALVFENEEIRDICAVMEQQGADAAAVFGGMLTAASGEPVIRGSESAEITLVGVECQANPAGNAIETVESSEAALSVDLWDTRLVGNITAAAGTSITLNLYDGGMIAGDIFGDGDVTVNVWDGGDLHDFGGYPTAEMGQSPAAPNSGDFVS